MFDGHTMSSRLATGKLAGIKTPLDAVILRFANIRFISAIAILFAFIAFLLVSTTGLKVVCITRVAGQAFTVSSMSTRSTASIRSTGDAVADVQAVKCSGGSVLASVC